jgi:hypothetical protein
MKKLIKNTVIISAFLLAGTLGAEAQTSTATSTTTGGIVYSVGIESGLSVGDFNKAHKANLGGSIQADFPIADQFYFTVNTGYTNFYGRNEDGVSQARGLKMIPAMAGIKFFPFSKFYLQADAGAGFITNKSEVGYNNSTAFLYAPQVGVQLPVSSKSFIDAGVRYESTARFSSDDSNSKVNFIGLRVAYAFGL